MKSSLLKTTASILALTIGLMGGPSAAMEGHSFDRMDYSQTVQKNHLRICSLDGGGIRGIIQITQLAILEEMTGKACYEIFDVFTGTSIGGIISGALSIGIPAKEILRLCMKCGPEIFKKGTSNHLNTLGWWNTQYDESFLENTLKELTENCAFKTGNSIKKRLIITGYDMGRKKCILADSNDPQYHLNTLAEILRMTSAAPTFFNPTKIKVLKEGSIDEHIECVDGGLYANNPTSEAIALLKKEYGSFGNGTGNVLVDVFSLGTGDTSSLHDITKYSDRSAITWTSAILDGLFISSSHIIHNTMLHSHAFDQNVLKLIPVDNTDGIFLNSYTRNQAVLHEVSTHAMDCTTPANSKALFEIGLNLVKASKMDDLCKTLGLDIVNGSDNSITTVTNELKVIDIKRTDKLYLLGVVNDFVLENDPKAQADFLTELMVDNPSDAHISVVDQFIDALKEVNAAHNQDKSIYSKVKANTVGLVISGNHETLAIKLDEIQFNLHNKKRENICRTLKALLPNFDSNTFHGDGLKQIVEAFCTQATPSYFMNNQQENATQAFTDLFRNKFLIAMNNNTYKQHLNSLIGEIIHYVSNLKSNGRATGIRNGIRYAVSSTVYSLEQRESTHTILIEKLKEFAAEINQ